jgi:hypothetical protein
MAPENQEIEREKLKLERDRFAFEQEKFRETQKTEKFKALMLFIPLLAAILTIAYSSYSSNQEAKNNFELKAAEIVMNANGPLVTYHKAIAMKYLFNDSLPDDFAASFNPADRKFGGPDYIDSKKELLKLIVENPQFDRNDTIELWCDLFPGDEWINHLRKGENLSSNDSYLRSRVTLYK